MHVRPVDPADPADVEATRAIYNDAVVNTTVVFDLVARSAEEQRIWLGDRTGVHAVLLAEDDSGIVGFGSLSPYRDRPAYRTTVEDSIYVHPDHQGHGVGSLLLAALIEVAVAHGFHTMLARITGHNGPSIALHKKLGFDQTGVEREVGRKFGQWLDVVVMQRML